MQLLYQAANGLEAHMILDLLHQQELHGRIDGAFLQGGIGELPAGNMVRVMVDEADYPAAKAIIDQWDAAQPAPDAATPASTGSHKSASNPLLFLAGLALGAACAWLLLRAPLGGPSMDRNGDGKPDETWIASASGQFLGSETDRNFDGKIDLITHLDARGVLERAESDDNFDGVFESEAWMRHGEMTTYETDTDGDSYRDYRTRFVDGVLSTGEYIDPASGKPRRISYFKLGKVAAIDADTNLDGVMDQRTVFDANGEPAGTSALP